MNKLNNEEVVRLAKENGYSDEMTFCRDCAPCCPTISYSENSDPEREVKIVDDFGNQIFMSKDQLKTIVEFAKEDKIRL